MSIPRRGRRTRITRAICSGAIAIPLSLALLFVGAIVSAAHAAPAALTDPTPEAIDAIFAHWNNPANPTPGVALAVIRDEKVIYSRGYGFANLDHAIPISTNTVFDVGSTSKQFTAACVLLLAEEGKLALTDDIRKYFPDLPVYGAPITIAHLLHHTSGLRDYTSIMGLANLDIEADHPDDLLLDIIYRQKGLNFPTGERFDYTNTGYFLLGEIVRRVSGTPMSQFAKARIFEPLGMDSTIFWDDHTMTVPNRADSFYPREGGGYHLSISLMDNVGDGGIYTTVEDLAKWDANFYHNKLGKGTPDFLDQMQKIGTLNSSEPIGYASGLFIGSHRGHHMVSHGGAWRGFRAELVRFPEEKLTVICLANLGTIRPTPLALRVADLYFDDTPDTGAMTSAPDAPAAPSAAPTITLADADWERFLGRFKAGNAGPGGPTWTVTRREQVLIVRSSSGLAFTARPIAPLEFESIDRTQLARLTFASAIGTADASGALTTITQTIADTPDVVLTRVVPMTDPAAGLDDFVGAYDSSEIGGWMRITTSGGKLLVASTDLGDPFPVERSAPDTFALPGFELVFTRDAAGKVEGITVNVPRASGMRYAKRTSE